MVETPILALPPDATAADFDDGSLPSTLDALSGPLFLALGEEEDAELRQHLFPLRARFRAHGKSMPRALCGPQRLSIDIAKVANGIRRLAGCDVQFVPVCSATGEI
jgi:hypothetical protein